MSIRIRLKEISLAATFSIFCLYISAQKTSDKAPLFIISDVKKNKYYNGDTILFTIKNREHVPRGYTIEAYAETFFTNSKSYELLYNGFYTAYFNNDTSLLMNIKRNIQKNGHNKGKRLPVIARNLIPYPIPADSISRFIFIVKGKATKNAVEIRFSVIPDIVEGEAEYSIETRSFWLFVNPI
jgi:hypothetical protein